MKKKFAIIAVAAVFGLFACQAVEDEVRQRADDEIDRQQQRVEERVDDEINEQSTRIEDRVEEEITNFTEDGGG